MGIEPTNSAWEADVMPLNYTCKHSTYIIQCFSKKASGFLLGKQARQIFLKKDFSKICIFKSQEPFSIIVCAVIILIIALEGDFDVADFDFAVEAPDVAKKEKKPKAQ